MPADAYETARQAQQRAVKNRRRRLRRNAAPVHTAADAGPPAGSPTQQQGHVAEMRAAHLLQARGIEVLAANLRCRAGEIDLVAREDGLLLFVEVRERHHPGYGGAAASVNRAKQARLIRAAQHFLPRLTRRHFGGIPPACRFDVVAFDAHGVRWIRNAFGA